MAHNSITVTPVDGGWMVAGGVGLEPLFYRSGARAEAHARAIARFSARSGGAAEVEILDLARRRVGLFRYRDGEVVHPEAGV